MSVTFSAYGYQLDLRINAASHDSGTAAHFRDLRHAERTLRSLWDQDKDLHRLRSYLAGGPGWRDLEVRSHPELLRLVAEALCNGRLLLQTTAVSARVIASVPKSETPPPEVEEWVEAAPESESEEEPEERYTVSIEAALALAESNRELAELGEAFKELCSTPGCPICNAQKAVLGG